MDWPTVALIAVIILAAVAFAWMGLMLVMLRHTKKMQDKITEEFTLPAYKGTRPYRGREDRERRD